MAPKNLEPETPEWCEHYIQQEFKLLDGDELSNLMGDSRYSDLLRVVDGISHKLAQNFDRLDVGRVMAWVGVSIMAAKRAADDVCEGN